MGSGWLVGVGINLVGSIMINLGTNVMKMGHNRLAATPCSSSRPRPAIYKFREWQIGVTLFSVGNVANFVSFGYAAQSLLAAIGCIQFVSNVIFASWVLKEQVSRSVLAATACIVAGCVLLVSGGSHVSEKYTYKQLLHLYGQPAYVSYLSVGGVAVLLAYGGYWMGQKAVISKGVEATRRWTAVLPILYSIFSALIGTQSVLFSKTLAVLLRSTATGDNQLNKWFTWFVLLAFLTSAVFWVTRLNKGLRMFPALIIVPSLQICWTLFSILSGMLYFQEYEGMKPGPTAMFVIGVVVVFAGVFLLTHASQPAASSAATGRPAAELLATKTRIAYVGSDTANHLTANAPGRTDWQLPAVRPDQESSSPQQGLTGVLRHAAQLQQGQAHQQLEDGEEEASDEEEYERALLACTSGRCGGRSNSSHLGMHLPPRAQQAATAAAVVVEMAGQSAADNPEGLQQLSGLSSGASVRGKRGWLRKASSLKRRVAFDFSLDETAAAKLSLGLGDSHTPGFSLFTLPMVDIKEIPNEASSWRLAEPVNGRSYGRLPDTSMPGGAPQQGLPLLSVPAEFDETGCISHHGGGGGDSGGAAAVRHTPSSFTAASAGGTSFTSFTWPPGRSDPSEGLLPQALPQGPFTSINPLANAIDVKAAAAAATAGSTAVKGLNFPLGGPSRTVSEGEPCSPHEGGSKWKVLQQAIKSNVQELKTMVSKGGVDAAAAAAGGVGAGRAYGRMASQEGAASTGDGGSSGSSSSSSRSPAHGQPQRSAAPVG